MAANDELTKRVLWKLDLHVLPPLSLLWLANFIDRSNIGNARIAGLEADTHLKDTQFNVVLAAFFCSRSHSQRWLPFLVASWGVVTVLTTLAQNCGGLIAIRLAIGFCEGGILPGMVRNTDSLRDAFVGIFYSFAAIAGAFGGLLATAIMKMDGIGGLAGWRWIFILEGIVTILFALGAAFILPADLQSAKFFTDEERAHALRRMKADGAPSPEFARPDPSQASSSTDDAEKAEVDVAVRPVAEQLIYEEEERFEWREVARGFAYFGFNTVLYSYSLFLSADRQVAPFVRLLVKELTIGVSCRRLHKTLHIGLPTNAHHRYSFVLSRSVGYALAIRATNDYERYAAVFLMAAGMSILPNNTSGHYKKATTTAMQLAIANAACYCLWENKARREGRRQQNIQDYLDLVAAGKTRAPIGDRHPDFRFTL
ncbi:major facilitator superfamily domain-containing protein [Schizophyllum commune]